MITIYAYSGYSSSHGVYFIVVDAVSSSSS